MLTRPEESKVIAGEPSEPFPDPEWQGCFPTVCEYCTTDRYADGSARERSSLTVRVQEGKLLVVLSDPTVTRSLYRVGQTVELAVLAIEEALTGNTADWRRWKQDFGSKRKAGR